jgi:hypothetical protein
VKPTGRANIIIQTVISQNGSRGNISTRCQVQPISGTRSLKSPLGDCLGINGLHSQQRGERAQREDNRFFHTLIPYLICVVDNLIFRTTRRLTPIKPESKEKTKQV